MGFSLLIVHTALFLVGIIEKDSDEFQTMLSLALMFLWFRSLGFLRIFSATRHLVRLVMEVVMEMWSFVIFLIVLWLQYAVIQYIIRKEENTESWWIGGELRKAYLMSYGEFSLQGGLTTLQWIYFIFFTVLIPLVFFNLLVSILGNTFDRVISEREAADYKEKALLIFEIEKMFKCSRKKKRMGYLYASVHRDGTFGPED